MDTRADPAQTAARSGVGGCLRVHVPGGVHDVPVRVLHAAGIDGNADGHPLRHQPTDVHTDSTTLGAAGRSQRAPPRSAADHLCGKRGGAARAFILAADLPPIFPRRSCCPGFVTAMAPISDSIILIQAARHDLPFAKIRLAGTLGYIAIVLLCGRLFTAHPEWNVWLRVGDVFDVCLRSVPVACGRGRCATAARRTPQAVGSSGVHSRRVPVFAAVRLLWICRPELLHDLLGRVSDAPRI